MSWLRGISPLSSLQHATPIGMDQAMPIDAFDDQPPDVPHLTAYDEQHIKTYLRLLDADHEGADWKEAVQIIFGIDPANEPERAQRVHDSHLARARWMTTAGYRDFLKPPRQ